MAFLEDTDVVVDGGHDARNGGLTRTGASGENEVIGELGRLEPSVSTLLLYLYVVGQSSHFLLYVFHADKLVEFLEWVFFEWLPDDVVLVVGLFIFFFELLGNGVGFLYDFFLFCFTCGFFFANRIGENSHGNEEGGKETREIKAKGHKFGKEWTVVRTASAGMPSLKVKYCENCKGEEEGGKLEKEGSSVLEKERVFGDNRFKTSLAIADQFKNANNGKAFENIIVASGADFADALSASYLAKVKNAPILLVANKATVVINDTIEYIKKNAAAGANVYLVGGSSVVPNSMITDLKKLGFKAKRLAGSNRYDTNIEVLKEAGVTNEKILIASGMDYADALSASAVGLPILLVAGKGKSLTPNQKAYLQSLKDVKVEKGAAPLSKAYIIGGTGAVSAGILKQAKEIFAAAYRVAGSNRYETSVKVAETFFKKETPKTVAVAYGMNYPDGLCGGPLAIAYKCPLILTVNQKPDAAVAYAKSIKAASVVAFGGKQLISVETMNKILGK